MYTANSNTVTVKVSKDNLPDPTAKIINIQYNGRNYPAVKYAETDNDSFFQIIGAIFPRRRTSTPPTI